MTESRIRAKKSISIVAILIVLISIAVSPWNLLDAINIPKLFLLCSLAFILSLSVNFNRYFYKKFKSRDTYIFLLSFFVIALLISTFFSRTNILNNWFGVQGRLTGFITFSALFVICSWIYIYTNPNDNYKFIFALGASGFISNVYYIFQYFGLDFTKWERVYGASSSVLGNPNFVTALASVSFFAGISFFDSQFFKQDSTNNKKSKSNTQLLSILIGLAISLSSIFAISLNPSQQGFITIAFVSPFWALLVLRARLANRKKLLFFGIFSALFVVIIYFATAQTALSSLADFFQANFAPRIIYWTTSLFIFIHFPLFGVGMNGIFDYFREYRSAELANQLNVGLDVGSNTSHNLPIEFLVGGGIVVFVLYISLQFLVVVGYFKKRGQHSLFEKNLLTIWFANQFQSLINPQPITLLMWNFIFGAILAAGNPIKDAVVGEKESRREAPIVSKKLTREKKHLFMYIVSILSAFSLVSSGLLLKADNQFRRAIESSDLYAIYDKSQAYPTNGNRILYAAKIMCLNGRPKEAATLVKNGMGDYPRDFELIRFALTIEEPESVRKSIANKIMKLDPQNPDLTMESLLKTEMNCGKN